MAKRLFTWERRASVSDTSRRLQSLEMREPRAARPWVPRRRCSPMLAAVAAGTTPIIPDLPIIRARDAGEQRATFFELFFDLVYVFAVTQLSHHLLAELTWAGAAETA